MGYYRKRPGPNYHRVEDGIDAKIKVCKVLEVRGRNVFRVEVEDHSEDKEVLVRLRGKFINLIYIRKGMNVLVELFDDYGKIRGEIVGIAEEKASRGKEYGSEDMEDNPNYDDC